MKNTLFNLLIISLFLTFNLRSQITRNYYLANFNGLSLGSAFKINVTNSKNFKVLVKGKKEDLDDLQVYIKNSTLIAKYKTKWSLWSRSRKSVEFLIEMPTITNIDLSGASQSKISGFDDLNKLNIELSGASQAYIDVFAADVNLELSGASTLKLIGRANKMNADLTGASSMDAGNFPLKNMTIDASGASNAKVSVSETLNVEASGAATIRYLSKPKNIHKNTSGGSNVQLISN